MNIKQLALRALREDVTPPKSLLYIIDQSFNYCVFERNGKPRKRGRGISSEAYDHLTREGYAKIDKNGELLKRLKGTERTFIRLVRHDKFKGRPIG